MISGLIGIGPWGSNYIRTLEKIPKIELKWACSPHRRSEEFNLPEDCKFTNDYEDILNDDKTSAVIISTPPKTHYELSKKALLSGKNVLVEKPMTLSSEEALELHHLSVGNSLTLMVGLIYLYNSATQELKKMIDKGELGKLQYFYSNRSNNEPSRSDINVIWDFAPHDISIINYLTNKYPNSVNSIGGHFFASRVENMVDISLDYEDIGGFVHNSWIDPSKKRKIIILGSKKRVIFDDISSEKLRIYDVNNDEFYYQPISDKRSPLELQCLHFLDCCENGKKPLTNSYEGYVNVKILEAVQKSLDTNKEIKISL